jgi:hypothetical protein
MARTTDSPPKRLRQLRYHGHKSKPEASLIHQYAEIGAPPEDLARLWERNAKIALQIEDITGAFLPDANGGLVWQPMPADFVDISTQALRRAFAHFKLDPADPLHWRLLLNYFVYVEFGQKPKRRPGRSKKWTDQIIETLRIELEAKRLDKTPATRAGKRLANDKASAFYSSAVGTNAGKEALRKKIGIVRKTMARKTRTK